MKKKQLPPPLNEACDICRSPQRTALQALRELQSVEEIAASTDFDLATVEKHFSECVPPISCTEQSDADLAQLVQQAHELYIGSALAGAWPVSSSALAVKLRALTEQARRAALHAKQGSVFDGSDPRDPRTWSPEIAAFVQTHFDSILERAAEYEATC